MQVRQRRSLFVFDMPAALQAGRGAACDQDRKILVIVQAGIAHPASVQADGVIEERTVAVGSGLQLLEDTARTARHGTC